MLSDPTPLIDHSKKLEIKKLGSESISSSNKQHLVH
jgi:hypothetical protein